MGQNLEELIREQFHEFYGMSGDDLFQVLRVTRTTAKSKLYLLAKAIIARSGEERAFENANIEMKTIRLESNGSLKESMSFQQIDYQQIVSEEWRSSYWRHTLSKRFLFVVFQNDRFDIPRLKKVLFWSMPEADLETAKRFWEHTRSQVRRNDFEHFVAISDEMICHVRPKARNSRDTASTADGSAAPKKAYWLNSSYIRDIVS